MVTIFTALFLLPHPVLASSAPLAITPINSTIVPSIKLEWSTPLYSLTPTNPYQVQIDDSILFDSIDKDYSTKNTFYSPTSMSEGVWYWRVRAKDITAIWSEWSSTACFIYSTTLPSPSPTVLPFISPSTGPLIQTSPIFSSTPNPSSFPTATPIPATIYSLSSIPSSINSDQSFQSSVTIQLPQQPNTIFYLKGAFFSEGSSNYFGQTKYNDSWTKNSGTYSSQYKIQTDASGKWQGQLEFMTDPNDSGFPDSGDYFFKLARYTASGLGPTWTDSQNIYLNKIIISSPSPSPTPTPTPTPSVYPSPSPIINDSPLPENYFGPELEASEPAILTEDEASPSALNTDPQIASIAGVATVAGEMQTKAPSLNSPNKLNPWWLYSTSGLLFLTSTIYTLIVKYKPRLRFLYENYFPFFRKNS